MSGTMRDAMSGTRRPLSASRSARAIGSENTPPTVRRYYLAGPMRGIPQYNFPMFRRVAAALRTIGYDVISPAELDSPQIRAEAMRSSDGMECDRSGRIGGETAGEILARDVRILHDHAAGIVFLPGWEQSRGARLEAFVGLLREDFEFHRWDDAAGVAVTLARRSVQCALHQAWA